MEQMTGTGYMNKAVVGVSGRLSAAVRVSTEDTASPPQGLVVGHIASDKAEAGQMSMAVMAVSRRACENVGVSNRRWGADAAACGTN